MKLPALLLSGTSLLLALPSSTQAATSLFIPTADGDVQTFGGDSLDTSDVRLTTTQSGGLERHIILEYDLNTIPSGSTVTSASIELVKDGGFANTGSNPIPLNFFLFLGDGTVGISDFGAAATAAGTLSIPIASGTPANGTAFSHNFSDNSAIQSAIDSTGLLTVRIETDSFATANFASLENTSELIAPTLTVNFVPEPSSTLLIGLTSFFVLQRRKR